jgi:hypothetical protein
LFSCFWMISALSPSIQLSSIQDCFAILNMYIFFASSHPLQNKN